MEQLQYLNDLLSWARNMQRQIDYEWSPWRNGTSEQEQWYTRFNNFIREMEENAKKPHALQQEDSLAFSRQATVLYHEFVGLHLTTTVKTGSHESSQPIVPEVVHVDQHNDAYVKSTFKALVDTMIPPPWGAVDLQMDDYLIMILDHYISVQEGLHTKTIHLSTPTAIILDVAATELMYLHSMKHSPYDITYPKKGAFKGLTHNNRIKAIQLLETLQVDLNALPSPFRNNGSLVKFIVTYAFQMVKFGYYSEWIAYGSTRFDPPEERKFETKPFTWDFVGYPGVSYGYRALRGFLVDEFSEKVE